MTEERLEQLRRLYAQGRLDPTDMLTEERLSAMTAEELGVLIEILEAMHELELAELAHFRGLIDAYLSDNGMERYEGDINIRQMLSAGESAEDTEAELREIRRAVDNGSFSIKEMIETLEGDFSEMDNMDFELNYRTVALLIQLGMERIEKLRHLAETADADGGTAGDNTGE